MTSADQSIPLFDVIEIEVNSRCNRSCHYCPVSILPVSGPSLMPDAIFARIIESLERVGFAGRVSYHRYSEPLLRKDLENLVGSVTKRLPAAEQVLYTNGDLLSDMRYARLCEAGISQFIVTRHDGTPIPSRPRQVILYPSDLVFTNRGGLLEQEEKALALPCLAPSEMLIVSIRGDILLCYEDSRSENLMGNVMLADLEEIWFSPRFVELRHLLSLGKRSRAGKLCSVCNNHAHTSPGRSRFMETRRGIF